MVKLRYILVHNYFYKEFWWCFCMKGGLSLIVPAYNAEKFIASSLMEYHRCFSTVFDDFEIVVVCNACRDRTYEEVVALENEIPLVILNTPQKGKGNAVLLGFEKARYDFVGFLDADNPFNLDEVLKMFDFFESFDLVMVTKFNKLFNYQSSVTRRFFSFAGAMVFRVLFDMKFKDTQAGAKFMKRELWNKMKKPFVCRGFEFDMELLYKASSANARIKEFYIAPNETDFSTVKMRILPGLVYRLLKMRLLK